MSSPASAFATGHDTDDAAGSARASIGAAIETVRKRLSDAAARFGRAPDTVTHVAVSKFHPASAVDAASRAGQIHFGENRVAEASAKFGAASSRRPNGPVLHLIGPLQTNKARDAVRVADIVETLDRDRLATAIADAADREGRLPRLLVQVNVGDEPQKAGIARAEADGFIRACRARFGGALAGLMCIPPAQADPAPHFRYLATLAAEHGLATLSMGMSDDLEAAIASGATEVRVGTAIFGVRPTANITP